jgi:hypothetical protein
VRGVRDPQVRPVHFRLPCQGKWRERRRDVEKKRYCLPACGARGGFVGGESFDEGEKAAVTGSISTVTAGPQSLARVARARPRNPAFHRRGFGTAVLFPSEREAACRFVEGSLLRYQRKGLKTNASMNRPGSEDHRIHHDAFPPGPVECYVLPAAKLDLSSTPELDVNASRQE